MIELWQLPLLFLTALAAGFVDAVAGGGGLITLPVMLGLGFAPQDALGTNKLQATFGSGSAAWHYVEAGVITWRECARGFVLTFIGAGLGALCVQQIDASILKRVIPLLVAGVAFYALLKPQLGEHDLHPRMTRGLFDLVFGLGLGFYDGFFGPGTGMFWAMAFVLGQGFNLTRATGATKVMNFASNIASLIMFILGGHVLYVAGLVMGAGQLLGARLGSRMVVKRGAKFIRPVFISVALAITAKLLYDSFKR